MLLELTTLTIFLFLLFFHSKEEESLLKCIRLNCVLYFVFGASFCSCAWNLLLIRFKDIPCPIAKKTQSFFDFFFFSAFLIYCLYVIALSSFNGKVVHGDNGIVNHCTADFSQKLLFKRTNCSDIPLSESFDSRKIMLCLFTAFFVSIFAMIGCYLTISSDQETSLCIPKFLMGNYSNWIFSTIYLIFGFLIFPNLWVLRDEVGLARTTCFASAMILVQLLHLAFISIPFWTAQRLQYQFFQHMVSSYPQMSIFLQLLAILFHIGVSFSEIKKERNIKEKYSCNQESYMNVLKERRERRIFKEIARKTFLSSLFLFIMDMEKLRLEGKRSANERTLTDDVIEKKYLEKNSPLYLGKKGILVDKLQNRLEILSMVHLILRTKVYPIYAKRMENEQPKLTMLRT